MDGGILDDPDISMRQAIQNILEDEGLEQLERIPVDYDELQEKAEEVETEILQEARSQRKRVPVISDHTEAEAGLNGMSRSEIEETVWAIAQAEIIENDLDARIQAVRVYGSRTRDGLYHEDSDVDVVIAYEGTVREDELFSVLNEAEYKTGNMKVDMKPIRPDEDEGLEQLERIPVDYDELQEKAEEVEKEILQEARSQRNRVPVISDHTEAEAGLNGMSRSEIEENVWAIAQAEIIENDLDAKIQAVRVYGSRTRDGLYHEDSDVDVVIAYEGTVREDELFSVLNEAEYKTGNMKVDMKPIRPDKTGTLEDFLEKSERYLDEKTEQMKASGEYKPLAKVEELEEANYNMIDNVLNNMPPKKEPYLEYYAAECDEYHSLGKLYKSTNLDEILEKYREIIDDPTLSYYGNGMGIIYRDPNDTFYDEAEVSLISRKSIRGDNLDDVAFLAALPMVHEALEKIVEAFPDFRYYPPKKLDVHYYPEKMTADELAEALDQLAEDFDPYDYHDNFSPEEDMVETVALELRCGYAHRYIPFLKDIIDEECEESPRAEELLEKLKAYQPEIPDTAVPIVRINFCEDKEMDISGYQKLGNLDETTAKMDAELASNADPKTGMPEKTVQMYFTIYYPDRDQMQELKGKINIGDGNGGIVSQLKNQNEMKLHDESWLNYQKGKGEESFQAYMADLTDMQEHVLPYLQSFCSMEERAPEASDQSVNISKSEMESGKITMSGQNKRTKTVETGKKSIHERLQINKEIISKQQGKISKEKGVELMKE